MTGTTTAVKELGTLWVLDRINSGLAYNKKRMTDMRERRKAGVRPQGDDDGR